MSYRIVFTRRAVRDVSGLEPAVRTRIGEALERYGRDPLVNARKMAIPSLGSYRFRIGDYRVIFDLQGNDIVVLRVGHRREVYRR